MGTLRNLHTTEGRVSDLRGCQTGHVSGQRDGHVCTECMRPILGLFDRYGCQCDLGEGECQAPIRITTTYSWVPRSEEKE